MKGYPIKIRVIAILSVCLPMLWNCSMLVVKSNRPGAQKDQRNGTCKILKVFDNTNNKKYKKIVFFL